LTKDKVLQTSSNNKLTLSVKERISIPTLFPESGDLNGVRLMADIRGKTQLLQQELEKLEMKINPITGATSWTPEADKTVGKKMISFTDTEIGFLKDQIDRLDKEKKITEEHLPLAERIKA